ncbi:MAG TPA: diacylglycerol kinase family protein [Kiritimatiellia bacterium]|nr:diacylglycerol kinase family protein [Kiritimatiellia bacterium]
MGSRSAGEVKGRQKGEGSRLASFRHAFRGIGVLIGSQPNARIHFLATLGVMGIGMVVELDRMEWAALALAIALVWVAEGLNTGLEFLADAVSPDHHPLVRNAKDVAAGAVLVAALGAVVVGGLIFGPRVAGWMDAVLF